MGGRMSYGKVKETFWTDRKIRSLSDDAKMLALYFMTGPHRNMLGCMRVPKGYLMEDLGWSSKRLSDAIAMLCDKAFICRDDEGWTLILNQLKHDPFSVPNHAKSAIKLAADVPQESPVYRELVPRFVAALNAIGMASAWHPHEIAIPEPLPEPEPEPNLTRTNMVAAAPLDDGFDDFWMAYPRKKGKGQAERAWTAAIKSAAPEEIIAGLLRVKWPSEPKFIKHPATWLNGRCWLDEPDPLSNREASLAVLNQIIAGEVH